LHRIVASLAKHQKDFFLSPEGKLIPMKMKTLAEELEVHESTIARTVAHKYVDSPRGLLPLRNFFTSSLSTQTGEEISSRSVQELLQKLIKAENKLHPLSDESLAVKIQELGIQCARRTVAKYRGLLKIGNAHQRKQY
jgi:RNA polymerase sigma-54 factor